MGSSGTSRTRPRVGRRAALVGLLSAAWLAPGAAGEARPDRFDTVIVDAGHGGDDEGARGRDGRLEKDVVLDVARRLEKHLAAGGVQVVMTRDRDVFVPLEQRTHIANDARGDVFLSIHANAASSRTVRGAETFFLSLDATDEAARALAERENLALGRSEPLGPTSEDPLVAILGDLIATEHLQESQALARLAQERLARLAPSRARGVKQAPFVVLSGVQMPAALVEIGFITNPDEESELGSAGGRERIAGALAAAVLEYGRRYDARRGLAPRPASGAP